MNYPFSQAPTLAQLLEKFASLGVRVATLPGDLVGPRGATAIRYLEITQGDRVRRTEPLPEDDGQRCGWDLVRRLCRQLGIKPRDLDIGLDLD